MTMPKNESHHDQIKRLEQEKTEMMDLLDTLVHEAWNADRGQLTDAGLRAKVLLARIGGPRHA